MTDEERKAKKKAYKKAYHEAHKNELNAKSKTYHESHKDEFNAYKKAYSESHRESRLRKYFCINIEQVENYELAKADNFKGWTIHHRLETHNSDGERRLVDLSKKELISLSTYYHRPASELIFMKSSEHCKLHHTKKH